jgi:hypothetical protein
VAAAPLFAPDGWQVEPCEGEVAVFCISDGPENVGFAEFLLFALSGYSDDHIVPLTAKELPTDAAAYTADQQLVAEQALMSLAEEHLAVIAEDRAITFPHDTFTPLEMELLTMGALPALAFGFVRTDAAGEVQERYLNVAAFDQQFIYWFGINYDPANVSTFVSDTAVTQFAPAFHQIAASLPVP